MSRAKFEEWCTTKWKGMNSPFDDPMFDAWLAGRESMRDEAADICKQCKPFGGRAWDEKQNACFGALSHAEHEIRKIEP